MSNRRAHSPELKARVAMDAISVRKTLQKINADYSIHPIQVSQWKKQLLEVPVSCDPRKEIVIQGRGPGQGS
jgi:putative transposase